MEIVTGRFQIKQNIIIIYDVNMKACSSQTVYCSDFRLIL